MVSVMVALCQVYWEQDAGIPVLGFGKSDGSMSLDVRYFQQRHPYFCGQACAQMVLYMVEDRVVSQFRLMDEMEFIEGGGTRNIYMYRPFEKRDVEGVSCSVFSSPAYLRRCVDRGAYSIINIRFDMSSSSGHYILVTGYNSSGFFVHDPWPGDWGEPEGRETGADAFIETELLVRLWAYRFFWVLSVSDPVDVADAIVPSGVDLE